MIEQMGGEVGEQHQARDDPRAPNVHESCANLLRGPACRLRAASRVIYFGPKSWARVT
jgi:hypothetical protein